MKWTYRTIPDLLNILKSWEHTPYSLGSAKKQKGVDCVRFCCKVVDEICGYDRCELDYLPGDACFNSPKTALTGMRKLKKLYNPLFRISEDNLVPGDLLVVGPIGGGPGHLMIVGPEPNTLWHTIHIGVVKTGLSMPQGMKLFRCYRGLWASK